MMMTRGEVALNAFKRCLQSVDPQQCVYQKLKSTNISTNVILIGIGKASPGMVRGAQRALGSQCTRTFLIAPKSMQHHTIEADAKFYAAPNNLPDAESLRATDRICREMMRHDSNQTTFVFLVSGGGSALLSSPADGLTLDDKLSTINALVSKGATIQELNRIRQRLSRVKGGKLLKYAPNSRVVSLIISDVIGDNPELIASGPTVVPTCSDVSSIIEKFCLSEDTIPANVYSKLIEREDRVEHPNAEACVISSNKIALMSIKKYLDDLKYTTYVISSELNGNATQIGRQIGELLCSSDLNSSIDAMGFNSTLLPSSNPQIALIFGGETTVILKEGNGKGGRNQEMVLSCLNALNSKDPSEIQYHFAFLSAGTDGQDGPTDAAGAVITNEDVLKDAKNVYEHLDRSDSYTFWTQFNHGLNHIKTGPTGTNVMDVQILLIERK